MTGPSALVLSLAMLAAGGLILGGIKILRGGENRIKGVLMLVCAAVLVGNVLIWTV